jgi:hypothetical protein
LIAKCRLVSRVAESLTVCLFARASKQSSAVDGSSSSRCGKWVVVLIENQPDQCDVRQEQTKFASIHTPKQNSWFCRLLNCRGLLAQAASCALLLLRWPQQQKALRQSVAAPCGWTRMADWLDVHADQADCDWRELLLLLLRG